MYLLPSSDPSSGPSSDPSSGSSSIGGSRWKPGEEFFIDLSLMVLADRFYAGRCWCVYMCWCVCMCWCICIRLYVCVGVCV